MAYDLKLLYKVAKLYYKDNLKQDSIGRKLEISRYKVNRLLKEAREQGLVRINVIEPKNDYVNKII